jgi:nitrogen regulatory protein PII
VTVTEVKGVGRQNGCSEPRAAPGKKATGDLVPKVRIEAIVSDQLVEAAIDVVLIAAKTGKYGDGKVFVTPLETVECLEQSERGVSAA